MERRISTSIQKGHAKWFALFIMAFITFASYYTWEVFSPFKEYLGTSYGFDSTEYGVLQASFSIPSSFLLATIIGGILMDRVGITKIGNLLIVLMIISGLITSYGVSPYFAKGNWLYEYLTSYIPIYSPRLKILILGSFIFGMAAVNLFTLTAKAVALWFMDKNYGLASSLNVSAIRIGTGGALVLGPYLFNLKGWPIPIYTIIIFQFIVIILFLIYTRLHKKLIHSKKYLELKKAEENTPFKKIIELRKNFDFYLLVITGALFYPILYTILRFAPDMIQNIYHLNFEASSDYSSIIPITATVITPTTGYILDKSHRPSIVIMIGSVLLLIGIALLMFQIQPSVIPLFVIGLSFGVLPAGYWFVFGKVLGKQVFATASGIMLWLQQTALWGTPIILGYILDITNHGITAADIQAGKAYFDYFYPLMYLGIYAIVNLIICAVLGYRYVAVHKKRILSGEYDSSNNPGYE
ncbi:MAG: nitrate/nitrite transporter [Hyphomicrobiales bacterium]